MTKELRWNDVEETERSLIGYVRGRSLKSFEGIRVAERAEAGSEVVGEAVLLLEHEVWIDTHLEACAHEECDGDDREQKKEERASGHGFGI